jgi:hypothetical protein
MHEGRFTGAAGAHNGDELAGFDAEADSVQGFDDASALGVVLRDFENFHHLDAIPKMNCKLQIANCKLQIGNGVPICNLQFAICNLQ